MVLTRCDLLSAAELATDERAERRASGVHSTVRGGCRGERARRAQPGGRPARAAAAGRVAIA